MIFRAFLFVAAAAFSTPLFATTQQPEKLIYNGEEYRLYALPLYKYFIKYPKKRPISLASSTGLYRGYMATFEIKNNELFLKDIKVKVPLGRMPTHARDEKWKSVLPEVLGRKSALKIDWFSGFLIAGDGKKWGEGCLVGFPEGFMSSHQNYIVIEIKNGNFVKETSMDCPELKEFTVEKWCEIGGCKSLVERLEESRQEMKWKLRRLAHLWKQRKQSEQQLEESEAEESETEEPWTEEPELAKAREAQYKKSQYGLGNIHASDRGGMRNDERAVYWYRKAAEGDDGFAPAQYELGNMYASGRGVARDDEQAVYWYRRAAEQGLKEAQDKLAQKLKELEMLK